MRPLLLVCATVLALPVPASAQTLFRAPLVGHSRAGVSASAHHTVADAAPGGGTLAAIHFDRDVMIGGARVRSMDAGRTVALARLDAYGRVFWIRRFAEEAGGRPHLRVVDRVHTLRDGGALIGGSFGDGGLDQGTLLRVDSQGNTRWQLHPTVTSEYSRFIPAVDAARGRVVVLGNFFRGSFQLPGGERWTSRQRFTSFLAEIDLATGQVRWARRILGEGRELEIGPDGTLYVAGQFQRQLRVGRSRLRGQGDRDAFVARYASDGAPVDAVGWGTAVEDQPRGIALTPDGGWAMLVSSETAGQPRHSLLGFDATGQRLFRQPVGPRATLVRSYDPAAVMLALPGASRRVNLGGSQYDAIDHVELVRFSSQGGRVSRRAVRYPGVGLLVRSLQARNAGGRIVLSGALSNGRGSESFHSWLDAPRAPQATPATLGAVL